jgi:hypothetical protein
MAVFGCWQYTVDRPATVRAYAQAERGGVDTCDCDYCLNFRPTRPEVFPAAFLALLEELGIDPYKDGEIYQNVRLAPGRHAYAGWYHFVGTLDQTGDFPMVELGDGFTAWMCNGTAPRLPTLHGLPAVELGFSTDRVPWLLGEPEPM